MAKRPKQQQNKPQKAPAKDFVQADLPLGEGPVYESLPISEIPVLLSILQACELLGGISKSTIIRMDKSGVLSGCRVNLGGCVRFHKQALIKWINDQVKLV